MNISRIGKNRRIQISFLLVVIIVSLFSAEKAIAYNIISFDYPGTIETFAEGINDTGTIVGSYRDWTPSRSWHGFIYNGTTYTALNYPGAYETYAFGINNSGIVVGYYNDATGTHGYLYDGTNYSALNYPGARYTKSTGINDSGIIVGSVGDFDLGFMFNGTAYTTLSGTDWILDINNSGIMAGYTTSGGGFLYDGTTLSSLNYPGAMNTYPYGINDAGIVVGEYWDGNYDRGFVYDGITYTTLYIPGAGDVRPHGINDDGIIVGTYHNATGWHGFVATPSNTTPVPEPTSMLLFGTGLVGYGLYNRLRSRKK